MVAFSVEALELLRETKQPVRIELPPPVRGHCVAFQERPSVRFGAPKDKENYVEQVIQGVTVFLPRRMPAAINGQIVISSFLGFRQLALEDWSPL